ncbi:hypothetical protein F5Y10DRAFT_287089 [Nemania abortiva]|nr:hypothetical protein F5Y10DRAFT_287089 [Nemania abortiva]
MEGVPAELYPRSDHGKYLNVAYEDRWDHLKPTIVRLYLGKYGKAGKTTTLTQLAEFMKRNYSFHATPKQYRTRFEAWDIKKNVGKDKKDDAILALTKRKRPGTSTSHVTVEEGGEDIRLPPNKLMRHIKEQRRRPITQCNIMPGLLSSWNLPYEAFIASIRQDQDKPSPFGPRASTPEGLQIKSPKPPTPGHEVAGPSPNMQLVYQKAKEDRAMLFLQGRLEELVVNMEREDRKLVMDYFHNFYMYGFSKARTWGRAPWGKQTLPSLVQSPQMKNLTIPSYNPNPLLGSPVPYSPNRIYTSGVPTQLCNWSIHLPPRTGDACCTDTVIPQLPPEQYIDTSFPEELRQAILCSSFTSSSPQDLPLAQDVITSAIERDPEALELDAWKLAIIAGNHELLRDLFDMSHIPEGIDSIYPFHLAASFLDGAHACCKVFEVLCSTLGAAYAFHHNIDSLGHTILDALVVSILRSHTRISPDLVSYGFRASNRFPGEEMDICGRWGPDTPTVRDMLGQGSPRVPHAWKHPFCHTAVQAICHCIITIYGPACAPDINKTSGLFIRRCTVCGLELKLGPLHTLVVATFFLAQSGMPEETLFGAVAVLVCLLSLGADAAHTMNISTEEILGAPETLECRHTPISPLTLMRGVPKHVVDNWTEDCRLGWNCFLGVLARVQEHGHSQPDADSDGDTESQSGESLSDSSMPDSNDDDEDYCRLDDLLFGINSVHSSWLKLKCQTADMGLLWATIQTEMLTYRRVNEGDPWVSKNFSIRALEDWLSGSSANFLTPLVTDNMMTEHSKCGWFPGSECFVCPAAQDVSARYFMNMDIYTRSTFLESPDLLHLWAEVEQIRAHLLEEALET